jgi:hypothetical protein
MGLCAHVMTALPTSTIYSMVRWCWKTSVVHLAVGKLRAVEIFTYHNGQSVPYPHGHHCNVELARRSQRRIRRPWIPNWLKTPGIFIAVNHAVFDATSLSLFIDDLEGLLSGT